MDDSLQAELRRFLADEHARSDALLSSGYQGSAYLYELAGGRKLVLKESGGGFLTGWFHRLMLQREFRVYQALESVAGVPHSLGRVTDTCLVLEFVDGESLKTARHTLEDPEGFYDRLLQVLHDFHAVGVAHGDLKRKDNVLVTAGERPVVIDFGTAVRRHGGLVDRLMFRLIRRFDYNAWIKTKYRGDYDAITDADRRWYRPTIVESSFRLVRRIWRTVTLRQTRKRWRRERQRRRNG